LRFSFLSVFDRYKMYFMQLLQSFFGGKEKVLQYLMTENQIGSFLSGICEDGGLEFSSSSEREATLRELARMLDYQAEALILSQFSQEQTAVFGCLSKDGGSIQIPQSYLVQEIPDIADQVTTLLQEFRAFYVASSSESMGGAR